MDDVESSDHLVLHIRGCFLGYGGSVHGFGVVSIKGTFNTSKGYCGGERGDQGRGNRGEHSAC